MFTDDAHKDFLMHDFQQVRQMNMLPVCDICKEPIQDESYYSMFGNNICNRCMKGFIKSVEDRNG